jgi:ABC-type multidrug transport system ATPase subunit
MPPNPQRKHSDAQSEPSPQEDEPTTPIHMNRSELQAMNLDGVVDFSWENLSYHVQVAGEGGQPVRKTLLHNMSGTARGGRVLAVMGPSGAGKSTLFSSIIGRVAVDEAHALEGCVFLNDTVFTERYKKLVSFVAQDDIVMGKETPYEALYFSSRVRLGLSHEEAAARVEDTLTRLHLQKCRDTYLGIPGLVKGVSGGEKKRTNIGNELITNPYIMLLDEPTTGLDSVNALRVGELMRDLAHTDRRTVLCTIHSPSSELFALFDDLLLLGKGHVIYHGPTADAPAYFASVGYPVPPRTNPSEYYMNLLQLPEAELSGLWNAWEKYLVSPAADGNLSVEPASNDIGHKDAHLDARVAEKGSSAMIQLTELSKRSFRLFTRDPGATIGRLVQVIFFAVLVGLFYFGVDNTTQGVQDRSGALFMVAVNSIFMAAMTAVSSIPPERAVFMMEQSSENYNSFFYSFGKDVAEFPFQIGFPILYAGIEYFMIGFHESPAAFFKHMFQLILISNVGHSFGTCVASVFPTAEMSMAVVPMVMLPFMIVAGLFANTKRLDPYFIWLNYLSFPRYCYVGLFVIEFGSLSTYCSASDTSCSYKTGNDVINFYGFDNLGWGECVYALIIYIIGLKLVGAFSLWYQGRSRRGNLHFSKNLADREMSPRAAALSARALTPRAAANDTNEPCN